MALIVSHLSATRRFAARLDLRYPHEDGEAAAMRALYLAALTYRPGPASFATWLRVKLLGQTSNFRRAARRRAASGIRLSELVASQFDARYYYRESR